MSLLTKVKLAVIKSNLNMNKAIEISGVSRDTFYKKLKKGDQEFYDKLLLKLNFFSWITYNYQRRIGYYYLITRGNYGNFKC